jgi:hypothetical protein
MCGGKLLVLVLRHPGAGKAMFFSTVLARDDAMDVRGKDECNPIEKVHHFPCISSV